MIPQFSETGNPEFGVCIGAHTEADPSGVDDDDESGSHHHHSSSLLFFSRMSGNRL